MNISSIKKPQVKTAIPGPKSKELLELKSREVPKGVYNATPVIIKRGSGVVVEDADGNLLFDFAGGIGVLNVGYSNPEVVEVVKEQAEKFFHSSVNVLPYEPYIRLAEKLNRITPGNFEKKTMFVNSGAEAVENAVKIARKYTQKSDIIVFEGAFHGRTNLTMALNSRVKPYGFGFGPFPPGIHKIPFANCYRCAYGLKRETCGLKCAERLEEILYTVTTADNVAAVLLESIQGEGGFIVPPDEFIHRVREICNKNNILLIADEVQSGIGRSGKMFACEYWKEAPDIITTAKSLAAGLPLSAVTAREDIIEASHVGGIGGTYSGNPLSCVSAMKVLEIMERDNLPDRANQIGEKLKDAFNRMMEKYVVIGDVRGRGAMVAMELVKNRDTKEPAKEETNKVISVAYQNGLVLMKAGVYDNVIRILVPLIISDEQLEEGLKIIEESIAKTCS